MTFQRRSIRLWSVLVVTLFSVSLLGQAMPALAQAFTDLTGRIEAVLVDMANDSPETKVKVIFGEADPTDASLKEAVSRVGTIDKVLPIINGFSAEIPASAVPTLGSNANLRSMSLNRIGRFESLTYDDAYNDTTVGSSHPKSTGASKLWAEGNKGAGVGIAVIDTGISPMNDFTAKRVRLVHGPDLSGEFSTIDSYGHGTVMAGVIAGDGYDSASQPGGAHVGQAPHALLVSVKVAGRNGATDVSTVLAAMHWVASYRDQYNIRVVNLSWGTKGTQSYLHDPLNYAVERLWGLGITVVVAAGNDGPQAGTITKPADDPFVITVGAYDDKNNADASDDSLASWSGRGPTLADGIAKPDVVAPGRKIIATRSYGSYVEQTYPKALYSPSYIRGSGTSEAAAATSGAAALLIRSKPYLAPDQVKYLLTSTAKPIPGVATTNTQGAGRIDVHAAALSTNNGFANTTTVPGDGLGSLEASRGGAHVEVDCDGDGIREVIQGEITVRCEPWNGGSWSGGSWSSDAWTGGSWSGGSWSGGSWSGGSWSGDTWTGGSWSGGSWSGGSWSGGSWSGGSWSGGSWSGGSWSGGSWSGGSWSGGSWSNAQWTTGTYDEFTTAEYDEFLTAFWGNQPPAGKRLPGEKSEALAEKFTRL